MKTVVIILSLLLLAVSASALTYMDSVWSYQYDNASYAEFGYKVTTDAHGNIFACGYGSGTSLNDFITLKVMPSGDTAWVRRYDGPSHGDDLAYDLTVDTAGNVIVIGESENDYTTVKYSSTGSQVWVKTYDGPAGLADDPFAITSDETGNVYVTGRSTGTSTGFDIATIKYLPNGDTAWVRRYVPPGTSDEIGIDIEVDGVGNVFVAGQSNLAGNDDFLLIKYLPNGTLAWATISNGPMGGKDIPNALAIDSLGYYWVTGAGIGPTGNLDLLTIRYNPSGDSVWAYGYNGPGDGMDEALDIVATPDGDVFVTGYSEGNDTGTDIVTIKYYGPSVLWLRRFNGLLGSNDRGYGVDVSNTGDVFVGGYVTTSFDNADWAVLKYSPTGVFDTVWTMGFVSMEYDVASDIAIDDHNNVYAFGGTYTLGGLQNIELVRYSPVGPLYINAYSPVNLKVIDPAGDSIGKDGAGTLTQSIYPADYNEDPPDFEDEVVIYYPIEGDYTVIIIPEDGAPLGSTYSIGITIDGSAQAIIVENADVPASGTTDTVTYVVSEGWHYINGDANRDGVLNLLDILSLIAYLYNDPPGPAPDPENAGDANCDLSLNLLDILYLIANLYNDPPGPAPCELGM